MMAALRRSFKPRRPYNRRARVHAEHFNSGFLISLNKRTQSLREYSPLKRLILGGYIVMFKATKSFTSAFILSVMVTGSAVAQTATDPETISFPTFPSQLGGNGHTGTKATGGVGGAGGTPLVHGFQNNNIRHGKRGGRGEDGGGGGLGGSGTWILQNMPQGSAFTNQGEIFLGGKTGLTGADGAEWFLHGGRGGTRGNLFGSGQKGAEQRTRAGIPGIPAGTDPSPVDHGGAGGAPGREGEVGVQGAGGGGGGGETINFLLLLPGAAGGRGGDGIAGLPGRVGGSGANGTSETAVTTMSSTNDGSLQIGGDGGRGGDAGQGGSGGGGAGAHGFQIINTPTGAWLGFEPGNGGAPGPGGIGGAGGEGGNGTIELQNAGQFINASEAHIAIGRGADGGEGTLNVRLGGALTNHGQIDINSNGSLNVLGGTVSNDFGGTITNKGAIANNGTFANNGSVVNTTGSFANFGAYTGSGVYLGTFVNNGVVAPGNSIGTAMIDGDFVNATTLEIEIAGFGSGMHDFLDVSGTAAFLEGSLISFLSWEGYGFEDIAPQETKSLEFFRAAGGITAFLSSIAFGEGFLPDGFAFNVLNDGNSLFLEVSNNVPPVPLPPAVWLFITAILGLGLVARRNRRHV